MAADGNVKIDIKVNADTKGAERAEKGLERVGRAAKKTAADSKSGFAEMQQGVGRVTGAIGALRNIITGFGVAGLFMPIVQAFKSWNDEIKRAEERAKALRSQLALDSAAEQVKALSDAYRDLNEAIRSVADARSRDNELFDEEVRLRREAEDAASEAAEADALAAVDPNADDAEAQRGAIRSRFSANRARSAADRKKADIVFRRQRLSQQAEDATSAADSMEASLAGDDRAILSARTRASTLAALSSLRNEKDGTWYNPRKRTEEGDAERDRQRKEAEAARAEVKRLEAEKKAKERQIAELRATASHATKLGGLLFQGIGTAETAANTATVNENAALAADEAAKTRRAAQIADAEAARRALSSQRAALAAQISSHAAQKDAANLAAFRAEGTPDYRDAQIAAQNVSFAADKAINALTQTLNSVEARLKAAQTFLESQSRQQRNAWSESPAGL